MLPSSRTPEGQPNRCEVCGNEINIEASFPPGDALCPYCNCLVWFELQIGLGKKPSNIHVTNKQIEELAQIAALVEADLEEADFYERFLGLLIRALAAVGGAVWKVEATPSWLPWRRGSKSLHLVCQTNLPERLLSASREAAAHQRLLESVLRSASEQLVPPLVSATGRCGGANPTNQLLLIQPLGKTPEIRGLLEIFCRPVEFTARQQGYQAFVKSMCQFAERYHERRLVGKEVGARLATN